MKKKRSKRESEATTLKQRIDLVEKTVNVHIWHKVCYTTHMKQFWPNIYNTFLIFPRTHIPPIIRFSRAFTVGAAAVPIFLAFFTAKPSSI